MIEDVLNLPEQLRDAVWRVQTAGLKPFDGAPGVLICGVGGSAIGGDLATTALSDRLEKPIITVRGYSLPSWAGPDWPVLCSSYSGETAETLSCMRDAVAAGNPRLAATTGGTLAEIAREQGDSVVGLPGVFQPRAAVAYMVVVAAEAAALTGAAPRIHEEIEAAAGHLEKSRDDLDQRAREIAAKIEHTIPVIHGSDLTTSVARRWKAQLNENAKYPAAFSELPEAGHNELEAWVKTDAGLLSAIFLEDSDQHDRERKRVELTAELLSGRDVKVERIVAEGETRIERMMWAVMLGDLVSVRLAELLGNDPDPVDVLNRIKSQL